MSSFGTELKINVHVEPIDGYTMDDYGFTCRFYIYTNRYVEVKKEDMVRLDESNYVACIDSRKIGVGTVKMRITAQIPDSDFQDGFRTEVEEVCTGVAISK